MATHGASILPDRSSISTFRPRVGTGSPGELAQISFGANGDVWGLNGQNQIYRFDPSSDEWTWIPGTLSQISVGADGDVWGLNPDNQLYHFDVSSQEWKLFPESSFSGVAVGSAENVWVFNSFEDIYSLNSATLSWHPISSNHLSVSSIFPTFDGIAWATDVNGFPYRFDPQAQNFVYQYAFVGGFGFGGITSLAVGADAVVWGVDAVSGDVYQYW